MATRRNFLGKSTQLAAGALVAAGVPVSTTEAQTEQPQTTNKKKLHILMRSSWGTDEPTRATFVFGHGLALADAGHDVQIFLTHDATYLMRKATVDVVKPVGWPSLSEIMTKVVAKRIPVFACGACARARGITEADLSTWNAQWGSPAIYVSLVEWADHVISE
jgi:predicted peroxiredoxin